LFASVLFQAPEAAASVQDLRQLVAAHLAKNAEQYQFFLTNANGDVLTTGLSQFSHGLRWFN
jgi:hypothetical protein